MTIVLYRNSSVANKVDKNITEVATLTGALRSGTSVISPSFLITGTNANLNFNYFKVEEWNRYYFTGPPKMEITGTMVLNGMVDVLMSFKSDIRKARAIISRQEFLYNMYLDDNKVVMNQNPKHKIAAFPNSFNDFSYILAIAGNGQIAN